MSHASRAEGLDPRAFRQALGSFTTGVTIITSRDAAGQPVGLTANSFNSVSLDPPMVLWSLAKTSRNLATFEAAEHWAVHILSVEQEALSNRFAKSGEDKFAGVDLDAGVADLPLLNGCSTRLQCKTSFRYEGGDHIIFVGEVLAFDRSAVAPLAFHAGRYAVVTPKPGAPASDVIASNFGEDFVGFLLSRAQAEIYCRVRAVHEARGLGDEAFFLLVCLLAQGGQTLADVNRLFGMGGRSIEAVHVEGLAQRGLVDAVGDAMRLHPEGQLLTLHMLAEVKAIESELLGKLGSSEALALKSLLRQLLQHTSVGLPESWGEARPAAG